MKLAGIHPVYAEHSRFLAQKAAAPSLWANELAQAASYGDTDFASGDEALDALHLGQRLRAIYVAGLENNPAFRAVCDQAGLVSWNQFTSPPVDEAMQQILADKIYNADKSKSDIAYLEIADGSRRVAEMVFDKCMADNIPTTVTIFDTRFETLLFNHASEQGIAALAGDFLEFVDPATKRMSFKPGTEKAAPVIRDTDKSNLHKRLIRPHYERIRSGELFYTLTAIPTPADAELDGMDYGDYIRLFFEMCDQPWPQIGAAQGLLIGELNAARTLRITNDDGTDITMDIEGYTFCNSLIAKNVPGSEAFSAMRPGSLNGRIVSKGRFSPPGRPDQIIENLTLDFENGKLVHWHADKGQEYFEATIAIDEGAKSAGEIGFGTNPGLHRHVVNGLLVEKIGGSFHIALGHPYTFTEYMGVPVHVNNGNESNLHWDITTMLYGRGGRIYLDGRKIMENGLYLNPAYDVLNRGWQAIPHEQRPAYWRDYYDRPRTASRPGLVKPDPRAGIRSLPR